MVCCTRVRDIMIKTSVNVRPLALRLVQLYDTPVSFHPHREKLFFFMFRCRCPGGEEGRGQAEAWHLLAQS